jgi:hypothetical protein
VPQSRGLGPVANAMGIEVDDDLVRSSDTAPLRGPRCGLGRRRFEWSLGCHRLGLLGPPAGGEPAAGRLGDGRAVRWAELVDVRAVNEFVLASHVLEEAVVVELLRTCGRLVDRLDVATRLVSWQSAAGLAVSTCDGTPEPKTDGTNSQSTRASLVKELGCKSGSERIAVMVSPGMIRLPQSVKE